MSQRQHDLRELAEVFMELVGTAHKGRAAMLQDAAEGQEWPGHVILRSIREGGPRRASDVAESLHLDPSTVSRYVAGLVRDGLLERQADPADGRASLLVPTVAGDQAIGELDRRRAAHFDDMLAAWSDEDIATLERLLGRFVGDYVAMHQRWMADRSARRAAGATAPATSASSPAEGASR
jgi:DNA-binding MarR family transcriptional regulator